AYTVSWLMVTRSFSAQMNLRILFSSLSSISFGIPWTVAKYCVIPPTTISTISLRPAIDGFPWSHLSSASSIFSRASDWFPFFCDSDVVWDHGAVHPIHEVVGSDSVSVLYFADWDHLRFANIESSS
ncbi:unnamed protein product, partial [Mycena citricolor]